MIVKGTLVIMVDHVLMASPNILVPALLDLLELIVKSVSSFFSSIDFRLIISVVTFVKLSIFF